jgi:hypothetical protein
MGANSKPPSPAPTAPGALELTRVELRTLLAVDLGWAIDQVSAKVFLRDRGRPGWLGTLISHFARSTDSFERPRVEPPAYGRSSEYGRPTFSDEFANSFMPIVARPKSPSSYIADKLIWHLDWIKIGPTGALSVCAVAELRQQPSPVLDLIHSYHAFRRDVRDRWPEIVEDFLTQWREALPQYQLTVQAVSHLMHHVETYDIVDFDFTVDGELAKPKDLYRNRNVEALRALAGITRMSHVMGTYSEAMVGTLEKLDLGSRPDELWIVNVERLSRHHPEHLTDLGKRLYLEDVVSASELILHQRVTLKYVAEWVRRTRATFLDQLTDESQDVSAADKTMRSLLAEIAWSSDLYTETMSVHQDSGSSFFRTVVGTVSDLKEIESLRNSVSGSVTGLLETASAVFEERSAAASNQLQAASIRIEDSSRKMSMAAVILSVAAAILAVLQIWVALHPVTSTSGTQDDKPSITTPAVPGRTILPSASPTH